MAWAVFGFGFVVIALAVAVALGKGGQMPPDPVLDHPRGRIPDGPVDDAFLTGLVVPRRMNGYDTAQVDRYLQGWVAGPPSPVDARFDVRFRGYDMGVVDALLQQMAAQHADLGVGPVTAPGRDAAEATAQSPAVASSPSVEG